MCNIDENNNLEVGSEQLQFRFDIVEAVHIRQQCDPAEDAEHDGADDDQSCNT